VKRGGLGPAGAHADDVRFDDDAARVRLTGARAAPRGAPGRRRSPAESREKRVAEGPLAPGSRGVADPDAGPKDRQIIEVGHFGDDFL
jgi:hypothetical protein